MCVYSREKADIIGNICMDMCMEISHIEAEEGDEVIIWNTQKHILNMAKKQYDSV